MNWLALVADAFNKLPIERLLAKPRDRTSELKELKEILEGSPSLPHSEKREEIEPESENPLEEIPQEHEDSKGYLEPRQKVHLEPPLASGVTTEETVAYHHREIAKNLIVLEKHYAQKLIIAGKKCDCGIGRHLLAIETNCEDTISMVDNPDVYYRLLDWVKEVSPKSTDQAAKSGKYDNEYPIFSHQARDFRKELIGSLEPSALFTKKGEEVKSNDDSNETKTDKAVS